MKRKALFAQMLVHQKPVRFQIDCGASANILPFKHVEDVDLEPCSQSLIMWNGTKVKPVGTCALPFQMRYCILSAVNICGDKNFCNLILSITSFLVSQQTVEGPFCAPGYS